MIAGECDLAAFARAWTPLVVRRGGDVLRADQAYLEQGGRALLLEALCVEAGRKQPFYVKLSSHDRGTTTVRIDPMTHPERSEGVRALVAEIAARLLAVTPGARVETTNLVLPEPRAGGG
ncbi:MAG TPA: hypothetical protein VMR86_03665 [Myxococcota bacterium]|nr:hypothetical protein [Myxococcota bacterium]